METQLCVVMRILAGAAVFVLWASSAEAVLVNPGDNLALPGTTAAAEPQLAGTVLADELIPFSFSAGPGLGNITGQVQQRVVRSSVDGTIDFYWRVINNANSAAAIGSFRVGGFVSPEYNANWRSDGVGDIAPSAAHRFTGSYASSVNFLFTSDGTGLGGGVFPGQSSKLFFFDTTATSYAKTALYDITGTGIGPISVAFTAYSPSTVPLAVQQTPKQPINGLKKIGNPSPTATNVLLITHGYADHAAGWVNDMAYNFYNVLQSEGAAADWDIYTYDWSQDSAYPKNVKACAVGFGSFWSSNQANCPWTTLAPAASDGIQAANNLLQQMTSQGKQYQHVHLIAHSAGSNLIESLARQLKYRCMKDKRPCPLIHSTFLDAYDPTPGQGLDYGSNADWAEQYVDKTPFLFPNPLWPTDLNLKNAVNFDITGVGGTNFFTLVPFDVLVAGLQSHNWPYVWYACTVFPGNVSCHYSYTSGDLAKIGFQMTLESGRYNPQLAAPNVSGFMVNLFSRNIYLKRGDDCVMKNGAHCGSTSLLPAPSFVNETTPMTLLPITRGTQTFSLDSVNGPIDLTGHSQLTLIPHSPAWISSAIETLEPYNVLHFDYQFMSPAEDLLQVFFDGLLVYRADQRDMPDGINHSGDVMIGDIQPGLHTISFRVDPFGDAKAEVQVTNLTIGLQSTLTAKAGASQLVYPNHTVMLDGSQSADTRGVPLTFVWTQTQGNMLALSNAAASAATFVSPAAGPTLVFHLAVTNPDNATATDATAVQVVKLGDVNGNGSIDMTDVNLVLAARNTPANGPNDVRDLDGDGMITSLDARKVTLLCSRPRCATH